jgi:hypothetical protein
MRRALFLASAIFVLSSSAAMAADALPLKPGECEMTSVKQVTTRLEGMPGSGSAIEYTDTGYQVAYEQIPGIDNSKAGDPIKLCLISIPQHCPPGDNRGRQYKATNLRTHESWQAADAEHMCGGA